MSERGEWSDGQMIILCIIAFIIPLAGLIIGFCNRNKQPKREQCDVLIWISVVMSVIYAFILH